MHVTTQVSRSQNSGVRMRTPATGFEALGGVAKGPPVCACGLPFVPDIPPIRNLWPIVSISARCRFHCREHCGSVQETRKSGQTPLLQHRTRFHRRIPITTQVARSQNSAVGCLLAGHPEFRLLNPVYLSSNQSFSEIERTGRLFRPPVRSDYCTIMSNSLTPCFSMGWAVEDRLAEVVPDSS